MAKFVVIYDATIEKYKIHNINRTMMYGSDGLVTKLCLTLATPWTVACQAPLSMGFSRQEYYSGLPFPPPGDLPHPGMKLEPPVFPALQAYSLLLCHLGNLKYWM